MAVDTGQREPPIPAKQVGVDVLLGEPGEVAVPHAKYGEQDGIPEVDAVVQAGPPLVWGAGV